MTTPDREAAITAYSRAARYVAAFRAKDYDSAAIALHEAVRDDRVRLFAIACAGIAAGLADELHGERSQLFLDGHALDVPRFRDRLLDRLQSQTEQDSAD